jgi:hypothetical protein
MRELASATAGVLLAGRHDGMRGRYAGRHQGVHGMELDRPLYWRKLGCCLGPERH